VRVWVEASRDDVLARGIDDGANALFKINSD